MHHRDDTIMVWSLLGVYASLAALMVSAVCLIGLESKVVHWMPGTICFTGEAPPPELLHVLRERDEGQVNFFGKVILTYDGASQAGLGANLPFVCVIIILVSSCLLIMFTRIYRRAYQLQFIKVVPLLAEQVNQDNDP